MTPAQKRTLKKALTVSLCALLLVGSFVSVPYIAAAIPSSLALYLSATAPSEPIAALKAETVWMTNTVSDSLSSETSEETSKETSSDTSEDPPAAPIPENALTVLAESFCWYKSGETPTLDIINRTSYTVDPSTYLAKPYPIATPDDTAKDPVVLIVHTHGTESYLPAGTEYYLEDEDFRSEDPEETVVAVGEVIAETLRSLGISVLHDTTMHDKNDFNYAYTYSRAAVREYLEQYPSIRYVLDIHRDSIFAQDGTCEKTLTAVNGVSTAQVMLVVGTDENGAAHPYWRENLTVAAHLEDLLNTLYPTLARPINLREDAFNQALSNGYLLVEVGSCGNTVEEAKNAGKLFATAFAVLLKENAG